MYVGITDAVHKCAHIVGTLLLNVKKQASWLNYLTELNLMPDAREV